MILFLSDVHLGRGRPGYYGELERDLTTFLRSQEANVTQLVLLGDVFDYYIEYPGLVPRGFVRLLGLLADWTDAGVPVTYLVGNHDPWHGSYFQEELGVRVLHAAVTEPLLDRKVYLAHGDAAADTGILRQISRRLLRHPVPVWLYKHVVPANLGIFLAREVSNALRMRGEHVRPEAVDALRRHARHILRTTPADVVVMGHTHLGEYHRWPEGEYLNTGCWYRERNFGRLNDEGLALCRWDGTRVTPVATVASTPVS